MSHQPYVSDDKQIPEFSPGAIIAGVLLGIIFGASSLYLVLKVGMTVSASIPVAVLSITLFRWLSRTFGIRQANILENNIVQTTGSAGESIAFGVGVTMPTLMLIGREMQFLQVMVVALLGGLLGILMMIPLRRAFIVKLHGKAGEPGKLLYPEGTACAEVLISGEKGGTTGATVFIGFGLAFFHKFITEAMNLLVTTVTLPLKFGTDAFSRVAQLSTELASELLGVGYIIGLRTAAVMMAGAILGGLVLTPTLALSSDNATMGVGDIYRNYMRYIGAGCVAAAGIISMCRTLPLIIRSFASGFSSIRGGGDKTDHTLRTERDLPPQFVLGGSLLLLGLLAAFLMREVSPERSVLGAVLVLLFGFLFVTVSSRLTGEIGSSSNPISGMTVATLLLTCLIFLAAGMTTPADAVLALSIGGVVCIAASNGGTTSQDLKTGYLVGATPRYQQLAILIGALTSAIVIGGTLILFNSVGTVYSQRNLPPVNVKDQIPSIKETEEYQGETYYVWRPSTKEPMPSILDPKIQVTVRPGKYLVDKEGQVVYNVDPTITGEIDQRDELKQPKKEFSIKPADVAKIPGTFTIRKDGKLEILKLWHNKKRDTGDEPYYPDEAEGYYVVDANGKVLYDVTGTKVSMKFTAPKTQVMGAIINGLLGGGLNMALMLIGACVAIMLELCGVSSLAFAVGVYIPMQYSTPIFIGGIVRWAVDAWMARKKAAVEQSETAAIAESETSPGVLLASGLIAGGSLAGVTNAFLEFAPDFKEHFNFGPSMAKLGFPLEQEIIAAVVFGLLALYLFFVGTRNNPRDT